jgi:two-component system sensor histidine kinase PilS (NtrC family)
MAEPFSALPAFRRAVPEDRSLLAMFAGYRLTVAVILLALFVLDRPQYLGEWHPDWFLIADLSYLALAAALLGAALLGRPKKTTQVYVGTLTDLVVVGTLTFASGGAASGLGLLMLAPVAGAGLLLPGRHALFFAAVGTLVLIAFEVYGTWVVPEHHTAFSRAGIVGAVLFAVALLASGLAERARRSEALATAREVDLENLARLSQEVVDQLSQGVIVIDAGERIRLMNRAAWRLLDPALQDGRPRHLRDVSWPLHRLVERLGDSGEEHGPDTETLQGLIVRMRRIRAGDEGERGTIVYLEDAERTRRQVQETKLVALGQLTANIAHEIRNPLGAISHAAQLLGESETLAPADRRLASIIHEQTRRMNSLIQDVLQLSRRDDAAPEPLDLNTWLPRFAADFTQREGLDPRALDVVLPKDAITVTFDAGHLQRVLWNLCTNAVAHAAPDAARPVHLVLGGPVDTGAPYIDVIDLGPGVAPEHQHRLFEPFFTTREDGTGLGLYLARQLCERNGARLDFIAQPTGGSCFRIQFPVRGPHADPPRACRDAGGVLP